MKAHNLLILSPDDHRRADVGAFTTNFDSRIESAADAEAKRLLQIPLKSRRQMRREARIDRSRSLLTAANRLLPAEIREEALDEWVDDVESAAEAGRPVWRRAIWILLRTLPAAIWRSRLPARARRERR